jgi:hypothetical protein
VGLLPCGGTVRLKALGQESDGPLKSVPSSRGDYCFRRGKNAYDGRSVQEAKMQSHHRCKEEVPADEVIRLIVKTVGSPRRGV